MATKINKQLRRKSKKTLQKNNNKTNKTNKTKQNQSNNRVFNKILQGGANINLNATGQPCEITYDIESRHISFSSNGQYIIAGYDDYYEPRSIVKVWGGVIYEKCIFSNIQQNNHSRFVGFSPDNNNIVFNNKQNFTVMNFITGEIVFQPTDTTHSGDCTISGFSPNGRWFISGGRENPDNNKIIVWIIKEDNRWEIIHKLNVDSDLYCISFSPDNIYFVTSSRTESGAYNILLWNIITGLHVKNILTQSSVENISFSPDGFWIVSGGHNNRLAIWKYERETSYVNNSENKIPNNSPFKLMSKAKSLKNSFYSMWRLNPKTKLKPANMKFAQQFYLKVNTRVSCFSFSPDSKSLLIGEFDGTITLCILDSTNIWISSRTFSNYSSYSVELRSIAFNPSFANINNTNTLLCIEHFMNKVKSNTNNQPPKLAFDTNMYPPSELASDINEFTKNQPLFVTTFRNHYKLWNEDSICNESQNESQI